MAKYLELSCVQGQSFYWSTPAEYFSAYQLGKFLKIAVWEGYLYWVAACFGL